MVILSGLIPADSLHTVDHIRKDGKFRIVQIVKECGAQADRIRHFRRIQGVSFIICPVDILPAYLQQIGKRFPDPVIDLRRINDPREVFFLIIFCLQYNCKVIASVFQKDL